MSSAPAPAPGTLYVCGTPIGNLEDSSRRLLSTLAQVNWIAAEDTRQTRKLLAHFDIHTPLVAYHEHNRARQEPVLIARLLAGESGALVTDAGMPAISDPGQSLVNAAHRAGVPVRVVPGPSAVTAALAISGLASERWCFEGFLPRQSKLRQERLEQLRREARTIVLFEAPHRVQETLAELAAVLGDRQVAVVRELTKQFEECRRASLSQLAREWQQEPARGEFVLVIAPPVQGQPFSPAQDTGETIAAEDEPVYRATVAALQAQGWSRSQAIRRVAQRFGLSRDELYARLYGQRKPSSADEPGGMRGWEDTNPGEKEGNTSPATGARANVP